MTSEKPLLPLLPNWLGYLFSIMFASAIVLVYSLFRFNLENPDPTPPFFIYAFGISLFVFLICIVATFGFIVYRAMFPNKFEPFYTPKPLFSSDKSE